MMPRVKLIFFLSFLFGAHQIRGQQTVGGNYIQKKINSFVNYEIDRQPCEVDFNMVSVFHRYRPAWYIYPYIIKRNIDKGNKLRAWRFLLFASFQRKSEHLQSDTTSKYLTMKHNNFIPHLEVGYEWHKTKGRFLLYYGISTFYELEFKSEKSLDYLNSLSKPGDIRGKYEYEFLRHYVSTSPLLGARLNLNTHFSISVESQMNVIHYNGKSATYFNGTFVNMNREHNFNLKAFPVYAVNLASHF